MPTRSGSGAVAGASEAAPAAAATAAEATAWGEGVGRRRWALPPPREEEKDPRRASEEEDPPEPLPMVNLGTKEGMSGGWPGVKRTGTGAEEEAMAGWGSGLKNLGLGFEGEGIEWISVVGVKIDVRDDSDVAKDAGEGLPTALAEERLCREF